MSRATVDGEENVDMEALWAFVGTTVDVYCVLECKRCAVAVRFQTFDDIEHAKKTDGHCRVCMP